MKKSLRMLIAGFITATVMLSCAAAPAGAASENNVRIKTDSRTDELIEAVELGLGSSLYDTETITYAETDAAREQALALIRAYPDDAMPIHWCMMLISYPVFANICKLIGRISDFQDEITLAQLKQKLFDECV